ncbi:retrovirus-related pol polyprotein from transposon TNT 1-94 [Tanacetum coccineum]|uniref:Retrovirus-related pol polyprotein from transposon TNT 1-94 n=1 Tax=Tanacetum coccineum TaxID=301880 RepID=A0ABQ4ZM24_9ASTR
MHNNIMAVGSRDCPPMLATGRYAQWQSRFMRYVDTKPNGEALRKCILQGPYKLSNTIILGQRTTDESIEVPERTVVETFSNIFHKNKAHYDAEKEAIHLLLTGIGDEIYSTDVNTSLFWEFGRFTSRDGESIESYYSRNKNVDTTSRYVNENQTGQFGNQRTVTVVGARETVGTQVVQQTGIQCFNCKEFRHFAKECRKPKGQKITLIIRKRCCCANKLRKRQHSEQLGSINDTYTVEKDDSNVIPDSSNMCNNDNQADQNVEECDDERVVLANLIANLKLDTDEHKKIQKQLKKANTSLSHELR